jgi:hypothetical protein
LGAKIEVTRPELSSAQLRRLASRSQYGPFSCQIVVLERWSRPEAAEACGVDRQAPRLEFTATITMALVD